MFETDKIYTTCSGKRFLCNYTCPSEKIARHLEACYLNFIRNKYRPADLYQHKKHPQILVLDTPNKEKTIELAKLLNYLISQKNK